ncbi:MAG: glycosyltransferase family 8 protein [bacterium]|nr:glycosyltransferase family 8 protein [bacterium]
MNILFSINSKFKQRLIDCIHSIERFDGNYNIYILHSDLSDRDIDEIKNLVGANIIVKGIYISPGSVRDFPESKRYPREIYYRIFAAQLLPKSLERVLYLDADIIAINPLDGLYNMDFDGAYFIACTHTREFLTKINCARLGAKSNSIYVNTGVMLMNLEALRKYQKIDDVYEFVEHKKALLLPDQDIITALYGYKVKLADSMIYNLSDRTLALYNVDIRNEKRDITWVRQNTVIIHYFGRQKPWNEKYIGVLNVFYKELIEQYGGRK